MAPSVPTHTRTVAIVDDDIDIQVALSSLLDAHGFKTRVFSSAEDWLDRGMSGGADCMLLDLQLGGMSGFELQRRLRASGSRLPIIFLSARDDEETRSRALRAGSVGFFGKPCVAAQLIAAIEVATG